MTISDQQRESSFQSSGPLEHRITRSTWILGAKTMIKIRWYKNCRNLERQTLASSKRNTWHLSLHTCPCPRAQHILADVILRPELEIIIGVKRVAFRWGGNRFLFLSFRPKHCLQQFWSLSFFSHQLEPGPLSEGEERGRAIFISLWTTQGSSLEQPAAQRLGVVLALVLTPRQHHRLWRHKEKEREQLSTTSPDSLSLHSGIQK